MQNLLNILYSLILLYTIFVLISLDETISRFKVINNLLNHFIIEDYVQQ